MDGLAEFSVPVREWFTTSFSVPTLPQAQGWPAIQRGEHALILAPTGSGKTLAAFLWAIDCLFHERSTDQGTRSPGPRVVYVSPLKALNNDVHRNLRVPLAGIREAALGAGMEWPEIRVAVRSGDTPQRERRTLLTRPPDILITTPESLYLLVTSPRARELFSCVHTVIVDEIHTLAGNKRGVHLSLTLERLEELSAVPFQRVGLSATIRPLDEVARFLGGSRWAGSGPTGLPGAGADGSGADQGPAAGADVLEPRPVTVVDAGYRKPLDLLVESAVVDPADLVGGSVWPAVTARVLSLIREHRTTLVFANSRRLAERTADRLNVAAAGELPPFRAHHGSMAREARLEMERDLKAGRLRALVGTSSLELGIDIGSVDLVVQLQSPASVAQGLQRVGRSGHVVGQASKGRLFPTHREDLVQSVVVAGGMLRGEVEAVRTPVNPLDVLAQQVVAAVAVEDRDVDALFRLIRRSYAYRDLTERAFRSVLEMLSGGFPGTAHRELRPRLSWDRVNGRLVSLPGSRLLALTNGGTIPDRGMFAAYLPDGKTRIGELDEEFVFETRLGDTFILGSQVWRVLDITDDRVVVGEAPEAMPRMPFWHGDLPWRPYELGRRVGGLRRELAERVEPICDEVVDQEWRGPRVRQELDGLKRDYALDEPSARSLLGYVASQLRRGGAMSSDRTVVVEVFDDVIGDPRMVVHSPFGGRVNGPWGMVLAGALRERTGVEVEMQAGDDGILFRLPGSEADLPLDLVASIGPAEARRRLLAELPGSAVFGAQFRMNAARALLLPALRGGRRTPFWLQRLRARDLLQVVKRYPDFPLLAETYRDCLEDVMDVPALEEVLGGIGDGSIRVVTVESLVPSPLAQGLLERFAGVHLYEWDAPKAERALQTLTVDAELLQDLLRDVKLDELLKPQAVVEVQARLQHTASHGRARTAEELLLVLDELGDLNTGELELRSATDPRPWLDQLAVQGRVVALPLGEDEAEGPRWVSAGRVPEYRAAFPEAIASASARSEAPPSPDDWAASPHHDAALPPGDRDAALRRVFERHLAFAAPVTADSLGRRYPAPRGAVQSVLDGLVAERRLARGRFTPGEAGHPSPGQAPPVEYVDIHVLEQLHRHTLGMLRREVRPVGLATYADFLAEWQHLAPGSRLAGEEGLRQVITQLRAAPVVAQAWERVVLPSRVRDFAPRWLDSLCRSGEVVWVVSGERDPRRARVRFFFRGEGGLFLDPPGDQPRRLSAEARAVHDLLRAEGALFAADIRSALGLAEPVLEAALAEMLLGGLVTNDSVSVLRRLIGWQPPAPRGNTRAADSSLEVELERRLGDRRRPRVHGGHRPQRSAYRSASRRVRERLAAEGQGAGLHFPAHGRWSLVDRVGIMGPPLPPDERVMRQACQLLLRHGVVTRGSLDREEGRWEWPALSAWLQRLELRGEVRRGYFVRGLPGVQFALPEALERLRETGRDDHSGVPPEPNDDDALLVLNACDPATVWGPTGLGGPLSFSRVPSTWVVQHQGTPLMVAEDSGNRVTVAPGSAPGLVREATRALLGRLAPHVPRVTVRWWDGRPVAEAPEAAMLETLGFYRDHPGMSWDGH